ncbi:TIMELESS-interacting protein [Ricinus communis]|uniref:Nucleic acid binding protein, putative n=1 Tax=Ricinus communis TaxID=3988 RepID=B9RY44_RICCO|nr:TIMELESS-interacting protein [Ricinus communis]EEF43736.1 nucleic acid binding protein, putative [Ricinus communis]|eukprot:XP_002518811.1 TIMELESS-interacting protein [Ricinus communis]
MEPGKAAPTGCYKCGRPGHWSRDCPDSNSNPNPSSSNPSNSKFPTSFPNTSTNSKPVAEKPKKVPRSRPKLTPDILLGDDGLGYVLRHFPRNFKYRGRGHEVSDLGNLIRLYSEWHSRLLPYYSYDEFVHKVEQVASTKRVRVCLRDLRERVASGGDPMKLHESPPEYVDPKLEQDHSIPTENDMGGPSSTNHDADVEQEDMLCDIFDRATEAPTPASYSRMEAPTSNNNNTSLSNESLLTDEQRARMEANRLKALERAAARPQSLQ